MTIDEAKEREAFQQWKAGFGEYAGLVDAKQAWLARAAQPVSVRVFELFSAMDSSLSVKDMASNLAKLGIEVIDA